MVIDKEKINYLLEEVQRGNKTAFEEFFYIYQPFVFRFIYKYTGNSKNTEDLLQDTFINFWQAREKLNLQESPLAYLLKIARNLAINEVTRDHSKQLVDIDNESISSIHNDPLKEYERKFLNEELQFWIDKLPEKCRAVFIMSRYEDMSYNEISSSLNISLQTVKNQMNKALTYLRKHISYNKN